MYGKPEQIFQKDSWMFGTEIKSCSKYLLIGKMLTKITRNYVIPPIRITENKTKLTLFRTNSKSHSNTSPSDWYLKCNKHVKMLLVSYKVEIYLSVAQPLHNYECNQKY